MVLRNNNMRQPVKRILCTSLRSERSPHNNHPSGFCGPRQALTHLMKQQLLQFTNLGREPLLALLHLHLSVDDVGQCSRLERG